MKSTILQGLRYWSVYQPARCIDFNGFAWQRPDGKTLLVDPMPLDDAQIAGLNDVDWILLTNADHLRAAKELAAELGASIAAPDCDREALADAGVTAWFGPDQDLPGALSDHLDVHWIHGGKTPAEAALRLRSLDAVLFGDAVRSHVSGALRLLPDEKVQDAARLRADVAEIAAREAEAVLLGDGDCIFHGATAALRSLR